MAQNISFGKVACAQQSDLHIWARMTDDDDTLKFKVIFTENNSEILHTEVGCQRKKVACLISFR